jgi:hypothetical protein
VVAGVTGVPVAGVTGVTTVGAPVVVSVVVPVTPGVVLLVVVPSPEQPPTANGVNMMRGSKELAVVKRRRMDSNLLLA